MCSTVREMLGQLKLTKYLNGWQLILAFFPDMHGACLHSSRFVYFDGRAATRTARRPGFLYRNRGRAARAADVHWESDLRRKSGRTEAHQSVRRGSLSVKSPVEPVHLQYTKNSVLEPGENDVPATWFDSLQSIAEAIDAGRRQIEQPRQIEDKASCSFTGDIMNCCLQARGSGCIQAPGHGEQSNTPLTIYDLRICVDCSELTALLIQHNAVQNLKMSPAVSNLSRFVPGFYDSTHY